jgi:hypothetical protein
MAGTMTTRLGAVALGALMVATTGAGVAAAPAVAASAPPRSSKTAAASTRAAFGQALTLGSGAARVGPALTDAVARPGEPADAVLRFDLRAKGAKATARVEIVHRGADAALVGRVAAAGGRVVASVSGSLVLADVPLGAVASLQAASGVEAVRAPVHATPAKDDAAYAAATSRTARLDALGTVTGQEVGITNASAWQAAGVTGAGVKIGIIDFFDTGLLATLQATGEVSAPAGQFCLNDSVACAIGDPAVRDTHGDAVFEIIHEMAPGAAVYLATVDSTTDLQAAMAYMAANGVRIVSHSISWPMDGPGDGTGVLDSIVAAYPQITFFKSAGNYAAGDYYRHTVTSAAEFDSFGYLKFDSAGHDLMGAVACASVLGLRWSDWGVPNPSNYALEVYDTTSSGALAQIGELGGPASPPLHAVGAALGVVAPDNSCHDLDGDGIVYVGIKRLSTGTTVVGDTIELMAVSQYSNSLMFGQAAGSASLPIADSRSPWVVSVGAIDPPDGHVIADYSSRGPTNDGRVKPELAAPSCVQDVTYGANCFAGTSAATPAAAGAAALVLQAYPHADPARYLKAMAADVGAPGIDNLSGWGQMTLPAVPAALPSTPSQFVAENPTRMLDTRNGTDVPSFFHPGPQQGVTVNVFSGPAPIPHGATAIVIRAVNVSASGPGYVQIFPTDQGYPGATSNVNAETMGQTIGNLATVPIGPSGNITFFTQSGGDLVADVFGYYVPATSPTAAGRLSPVTPYRVVDSRTCLGLGDPSCDPHSGHLFAPHDQLDVQITGTGAAGAGVPASGVSAVVLNVTVLNAPAPGYLQLWATGAAVSVGASSSSNYTPGTVVPSMVMVPVGTGGQLHVYLSGGGSLVVDVLGWFTDGTAAPSTSGLFTPIPPTRLFDSRVAGAPIGPMNGVKLSPGAALPTAGVAALLLNVTSTQNASIGYVEALPAGAPEGQSSTLNLWHASQTVANAAITPLGDSGQYELFAQPVTHVVSDCAGWYST